MSATMFPLNLTDEELQLLDFILQTLLRGGDPAMATRNRAYATLCAKLVKAKTKLRPV